MRSVVLGLVAMCLVAVVACGDEPGVPEYRDHQDLTYYLTSDGKQIKIESPDDWAVRRKHIVANAERVMGPFPRPDEKAPLDIQVLETHELDGIVKKKIAYHTDSKERRVHAWLLLPKDIEGPRPAVLCLHQTTGIGKDEPVGEGPNKNLHYALELAKRGYVTLSPDYPSFGEYPYDFPDSDGYRSGTMKAIYDNVRAVDVLESLDEVHAERIGAIGHSLGGHNAIFTAVFEPRITAVVSCCGFTRFHKYYGGKLAGWTSSRYMPRIASEFGNDPDRVPFDFPELLGALAPRPFLAVSPLHDENFEVSGVKDSIASAKTVYRLFDAEEKLQAIYPDAAHDFPPDARETAYRFFDRALRED